MTSVRRRDPDGARVGRGACAGGTGAQQGGREVRGVVGAGLIGARVAPVERDRRRRGA